MFDEFYKDITEYDFQTISDKDEIVKITETYLNKYYDSNDDKETWFNKIKDLSEELGYAREVKEYKNNPDSYKGHVGDISTVLRVVFTSRSMTPDLYEIMNLLGKDKLVSRFDLYKNN